MFKKYTFIPALLSIACLICGLVLLFNSGAASRTIFRILGVISLVCGIVRLADEYSLARKLDLMQKPVLVRGIAECAVGVILLCFTGMVLHFISFVVGAALLVVCCHLIYQSLSAVTRGTPGWWVILALCIAGAVFSLVMIFGGVNVVGFVIRIAGLALTIFGANKLIALYKSGMLL